MVALLYSNDRGRTRTCNLRLTLSLHALAMLWPVELLGRGGAGRIRYLHEIYLMLVGTPSSYMLKRIRVNIFIKLSGQSYLPSYLSDLSYRYARRINHSGPLSLASNFRHCPVIHFLKNTCCTTWWFSVRQDLSRYSQARFTLGYQRYLLLTPLPSAGSISLLALCHH